MHSLRMLAWTTALMLWLLAGPSGTATAQDRPDLLDDPGHQVYTAPTGYNFLLFTLDDVPVSGSAVAQRESAVGHLEMPGVDQISLRLYEPDTASRTATGAKLTQKNNLVLFSRLGASSSTHSGIVTGCKGQAQVKTSKTAGKNAYTWKFSCSNLDDALTQIGVSPGGRTALLGLFGTNGKLQINGKVDCGTGRCSP